MQSGTDADERESGAAAAAAAVVRTLTASGWAAGPGCHAPVLETLS